MADGATDGHRTRMVAMDDGSGRGLPSALPPPLPLPVLLRQTLRGLTWLHWPLDPAAIAHLMPAGTEPDVLDGRTYVGLVWFTVVASHLGGAIPTGGFTEANVRLYSRDHRGRHGVVFLSLDVDRPEVVRAGRTLLGLPYHLSRLRQDVTGTASGLHCRRLRPGPAATSRILVRRGEPLPDPSPLEVFLTARWGLHLRRAGRTWWVPMWHEPLALHRGDPGAVEDHLVAAAGVRPGPDVPVSALLSEPLAQIRLGRPTA